MFQNDTMWDMRLVHFGICSTGLLTTGLFMSSSSGGNRNFDTDTCCLIVTWLCWDVTPLITRFMGPILGPPGADRTQVGHMLATLTLLSRTALQHCSRNVTQASCICCHCVLEPLLLTGTNFDTSMDNQLHPLQIVGWNYLSYVSIPRLQRCNGWSLGVD